MRTPIEVYDLCRCFILDRRSVLGEELSDKILGFVRSRNLARLTNLVEVIGVELYSQPPLLATVMQIEAFFKKNSLFSSEDTCLEAARKNFELAERKCRITNKRLDYYYVQRERLAPDLDFYMSRAERYVSRLLGDFASFEEEIPLRFKITSGASATRSRARSLRPFKVSKRPHCTMRAFPYLQSLSTLFGYGPLKPRIRHANRVEVVPKNWKTHRTIACSLRAISAFSWLLMIM